MCKSEVVFKASFLFFGLIALFFASSSHALTVLKEDDIDIHHDIIILNHEVNTKTVDETLDKLHELQAFNKTKPIYLLLDSPGGEIVEGTRIINGMEASARPVYTVAMGTADSMATSIHAFGVKRFMLPDSELMFHLASMGYQGDIVRMRSRLEHIEMVTGRIDDAICKRSNVTREELRQKELKEWWVGSDEALKRHLIDDTIISTAFFVSKKDDKKDDKKDEKKSPLFPLFPFFPDPEEP